MKLFRSTLLVALLASANANLVKEKLMKFRDENNVDKEKLVKMMNDRHERRMTKMEDMLKERQVQLEDHNAGRRLLKDEDHERILRQVNNFGRKLEQMKSMDEEEKKEMIETEAASFHKMRMVDYLDFDA